MKSLLVLISLLAQFAVAGMAMATMVDFSALGPPTSHPPISIDITTAFNPAGYTAGGVTFRYQDFGSTADYAVVDSFGVFGTAAGAHLLGFATPATALGFNFDLLDVVWPDTQAGPKTDALKVRFFRGGMLSDFSTAAADSLAYDPVDPALGFATGLLAHNGPVFDHAELYFWPEAQLFTADGISSQPVPESATFLLMTLGGLVFGAWRYYGGKHRTRTGP